MSKTPPKPIEEKASGTQVIQELITEGCYGVARYQPDCDRNHAAQTATIDSGFVYIPQNAPWLAEYLHEMTAQRRSYGRKRAGLTMDSPTLCSIRNGRDRMRSRSV